jgi:hypothetical protein
MQLPEPPPRRDLAGPTDRTPNKAGPALELIGGGLVLLGSFLPWATVATVFGTVSLNGIDGDGKITMVLGLVLVLIAVLELTGSSAENIASSDSTPKQGALHQGARAMPPVKRSRDIDPIVRMRWSR